MRKVELENVCSMRRRIIEGTTTEPGVPLFWLHAMLNSDTLKKKIGKFYQVAAAPSNFGLSMWILHSKQMSQPIANFPWHFMKLGQLYQSPPTFTGH